MGEAAKKEREENNISTTITDDDDVEKKLKTVKLNSLRILLRAADFPIFLFFFRILFFFSNIREFVRSFSPWHMASPLCKLSGGMKNLKDINCVFWLFVSVVKMIF